VYNASILAANTLMRDVEVKHVVPWQQRRYRKNSATASCSPRAIAFIARPLAARPSTNGFENSPHRRLKELDRIAGGIVQHDLRAAGPRHDVAPK
jgi:hypothetical protein